MELRCPKCDSTDLKRVSLAYEEGTFRAEAVTRVRAAVVGGSRADLIMGRASTRASHKPALSKRLNPPTKWSYHRVIFWSVLVFLCGGWLVFYINAIAMYATSFSSTAPTAYILVATLIFAFLLSLVVRHNRSVYPKRFAEWDRSFVCRRCGCVCQRE